MHDLHIVHGDLKGVCVLSSYISTHLSLTSKGEHPYQQEAASVHRRLWPFNHHGDCDLCICRDIPSVVDLERHIDVIH